MKRAALLAVWVVTLALACAYAAAAIPIVPVELAAVAGGIVGAMLGLMRRPTW